MQLGPATNHCFSYSNFVKLIVRLIGLQVSGKNRTLFAKTKDHAEGGEGGPGARGHVGQNSGRKLKDLLGLGWLSPPSPGCRAVTTFASGLHTWVPEKDALRAEEQSLSIAMSPVT